MFYEQCKKIVEQISSAIVQAGGLRSMTFNIICTKIVPCSVVFKSSVCHSGKPGISFKFNMTSKLATYYRNPHEKNIIIKFLSYAYFLACV